MKYSDRLVILCFPGLLIAGLLLAGLLRRGRKTFASSPKAMYRKLQKRFVETVGGRTGSGGVKGYDALERGWA